MIAAKLDDRKVFSYEAVRHGSIRGAADKLDLSPSAISRQSMRAAKTPSGARVTLVLFGDGARHGQDR